MSTHNMWEALLEALLWVFIGSTSNEYHNICFHGEIRKNIYLIATLI